MVPRRPAAPQNRPVQTPQPRRPAAKRPPSGRGGAKAPLPTWVLVWIALALLVLVVFLANKPAIDRVLEETGFFEAIEEPGSLQVRVDSPLADEILLVPRTDEPRTVRPAEDPLNLVPTRPLETPGAEAAPAAVSNQAEPAPEPVPAAAVETRVQTLYFVHVNALGQLELLPSRRRVPLDGTPLTTTLRTLLTGPLPEEIGQGLITQIPPGVRLRSARVENGTAYLDLSGEFQFNPLGYDGYMAQLHQLFLTASAFPNIERIQILIEGENRAFLGVEGIPIGRPLDARFFP